MSRAFVILDCRRERVGRLNLILFLGEGVGRLLSDADFVYDLAIFEVEQEVETDL